MNWLAQVVPWFSRSTPRVGTVAAPAANGRLQLSNARYENFATGAVLTNMQGDLVGDRDRFTLTSFSAGDSASGSVKAQGNVVLKGPRDQLPSCPQRLRISVSPPATRQSPRRPGRCRSPVALQTPCRRRPLPSTLTAGFGSSKAFLKRWAKEESEAVAKDERRTQREQAFARSSRSGRARWGRRIGR